MMGGLVGKGFRCKAAENGILGFAPQVGFAQKASVLNLKARLLFGRQV